ncbi:SGNH/GDSL hydrolase family protein [Candidatus Saccharibacteria bacterium]|nr:SGNH/GDSL hydrolase family protein [Candidatus Saccharibacteria bacterium]
MKYINKSDKLRNTLRIIAPIVMLVTILQALFLLPPWRTNATGISWTTASPKVLSTSPASSTPGFCPIQTSTVVAGQLGRKDVCITGKNNVRFGMYYQGSFPKVVSFGYDEQMYRVYVPCDGPYDCLYLPQTDMLVTKQNLVSARSSSLVVYKNFSKRLTRTINSTTFATEYTFDSTNPDYILKNSAGDQWDVGGIGASDNGKWLTFEIRERAMGLLNTETFELKIISNQWFRYGVGHDVMSELAVSDDGGAVAIGGLNAYLSIYDMSGGCGDYTLTERIQPMTPIANSCPIASFDSALFIDNFRDGYRPSFSSNGAELSFYATSYTVPARNVVLRVAGYTPLTLDYLALGDSYSSGEGDTYINPDTNRKYYRNYTDNEEDKSRNIPREKCHISTRSYPYLLAHGMGLVLDNPKQWDTVACSGATAWDAKDQASNDYKGQGDRLKDFNHTTLKVQALNELIPGRQKQVEFVKKYKPKVITLTMGGNDVGFGGKVRECAFSLNTCDYATNRSGPQLASEIQNQYKNLKLLYEELYKASDSKAKIYILGYPQFINGDASASCGPNIAILDAGERKMIYEGVGYLNRVIKKATEAAGVKYIDVENSLDGHKICDNGDKYVTGVVNLLGWGGNELQESFHPNANGNAAMASGVWGEDNVNGESLVDYDICPDSDENACPNSSATKDSIVVPSYFDTSDPLVNSQYKEMTLNGAIKGVFLNVTLGSYSLAPNSTVQLTLHSEPVNLGSYMTDANGQLDISALIPTSVPAGYHTLILTGSTYSGEPIQFEQVILVQGSDSSDVDDNGTLDSQQGCLFIISSGVDADLDGVDDACDPEIREILSMSNNNRSTYTLNSSKFNGLSKSNTSETYMSQLTQPRQEESILPLQATMGNTTNASHKLTMYDFRSLSLFTTALILTTIGVLITKKRNKL